MKQAGYKIRPFLHGIISLKPHIISKYSTNYEAIESRMMGQKPLSEVHYLVKGGLRMNFYYSKIVDLCADFSIVNHLLIFLLDQVFISYEIRIGC